MDDLTGEHTAAADSPDPKPPQGFLATARWVWQVVAFIAAIVATGYILRSKLAELATVHDLEEVRASIGVESGKREKLKDQVDQRSAQDQSDHAAIKTSIQDMHEDVQLLLRQSIRIGKAVGAGR